MDIFAELKRLGALVRQLQGALQGNRTISGTVFGTSAPSISITAGSGFTASRTSAGQYAIAFDTAFTSTPAVVIGMGSTSAAYWAKVSGAGVATTAGFTISITDSAGVNHDGEAHFIAIGS